MKWLVKSFCLFLIPTLLLSQQNKFVQCKGKIFVEPNGKEILLKGINLGNWLNPEGYMFHLKDVNSFRLVDNVIKELIGSDEAGNFWRSFRDNYITQEDIHFIKNTDANHIRVPFNFKLFLVEDHPEIFLEEGFKRLDDVINWCRKENLYVVLDLHAAPGGQTGDNIDDSWGYPYLFENADAQKTTIELWKKIAKRYKNETIVIGYDLLNEPIPHFYENKEDLNKLLEPFYMKLTAAIRTIDKNHIVFLGGAQWNTNFKMFNPPFDKNLAYTFHRYWMPPEQKEIQDIIDLREKFNSPIWLGESGENKNEWIESFRSLLEENNIGWCFWPYKKMDSNSCFVSFAKTKEWDEIINYAETPRKNFEDLRKRKPAAETVKKALADLIENIKFKNNKVNTEYIKALGLNNTMQR